MNSYEMSPVTPLALAVLAFAVLALAPLADGQALGGSDGVPVVGDLNAPMGVLVAPDGALWIVDSGVGGDERTEIREPGGEAMLPVSLGTTSRVLRLAAPDDPDATPEVMATLPSLANPFDTVGGARLALVDGEVYVTSGAWVGGPDSGWPAMDALVVRIVDGEARPVADTGAFEERHNPDGFILESHPFGLAAAADGSLWLADAGANTLLKVDPASGEIALVTVFDGLPGPFPNPARDDAMEMDPVPTAVVAGEALGDPGSTYVSLLPGGPFPPGSSRVVRVAADGTVSERATGLTMTTDLQVGPDGRLYAVQFGEFGEQGPVPESGAVVRLVENGDPETVVEGLSFPSSIAFDDDGNAFVSVGAVGPPGSGAVLRFDGLAAPR